MKSLTGVERSIQIFNKKKHELVDEITIDISLVQLLSIIGQKEDDPNLYGFYELSNQQTLKLQSFAEGEVNVNFNLYYYVLACFGIYE